MYSPMLRVAPVTIAAFPSSLIMSIPLSIAPDARAAAPEAPASRLLCAHLTVLARARRDAMMRWASLAAVLALAAPALADDAADWRVCERASANPQAGIAACARLIDG